MSDTLKIYGVTYTGVTSLNANDLNHANKQYIRPEGTKSITANGTGIDVASYAAVDVAVPSSSPSLQSKTKTYTPSETAQSETVTADSGYDGLSQVSVSVGAIPTNYVGSGVARRTISDVQIDGAEFTVPAGYYASQVVNEVHYGTAGTPTLTTGTVTSASVSVTPTVTNLEGYIFGGTETGQPVTIYASDLVSGQSMTADDGGDWTVANVETLTIPYGTATAPTSISGTAATVSTGTNTLTLTKSVSVTPRVTTQGWVNNGTAGNSSVSLTASVTTKAATTYYPQGFDQSIGAGQYLAGAQTIKAVTYSGLSASNIANGVTVKIGDSADDDRIASVTGTLAFQTYYTGSSAPSSSLGVNGDIYLKTS